MSSDRLTTEDKALKINLKEDIYGCFAEIGAGQEVAANFFKAGGSSGTIAFTRSAYDMKISDSMYGPTSRYVCEERLATMLSAEYNQLTAVLPEKNKDARFFAFCNTVESLNQGHGWIGIRYQKTLGGKPNDIVLHVKLHDSGHKSQQESLGILGVNLIYAAFFHHDNLDKFIDVLVARLPREKIEIDMLRFSGPDFEGIDNRLVSLNLVQRGITDATMFDLAKNVLQPATALYKKNVLLMRGRFRPVTKVHIDMIEKGKKAFLLENNVDEGSLEVIFELTLKDLTADGKISIKDFMDRAELLGSLGYTVMISNYLKHYNMVEYLSATTKGSMIGVIVGIYNLNTIFDERYYDNLQGGLLEAFGRGFGNSVKIYVYPAINVDDGLMYDLSTIKLPKHLYSLLQFMIENGKLQAINEYDKSLLHIMSDDVLSKIKMGSAIWEEDVPYEVAQAIKFFKLFGYKSK